MLCSTRLGGNPDVISRSCKPGNYEMRTAQTEQKQSTSEQSELLIVRGEGHCSPTAEASVSEFALQSGCVPEDPIFH